MNLDLNGIASRTVDALDTVWTTLGETDEGRELLIQDLCRHVESIYSGLLSAQEKRVTKAKQDIEQHSLLINTISQQLGLPLPTFEDDQKPLLRRLEDLSRVSSELSARRTDRLRELRGMHVSLHELWECLEFSAAEREPEFAVFDESRLDAQRSIAYQTALDHASRERRAREAEISSRAAQIADLCKTLAEPESSSALDAAARAGDVVGQLGCGRRVLEQLGSRLAQLEAKRDEREERVKEFAADITALWDRLAITEEERDAFLEEYQGLGPQVLAACANELARLQALKSTRMRQLVDDARERVDELWNKLGFDEEQRGDFYQTHFCSPLCDDATLDAHEAEEARLQQRVVELQPILAALERREELLEEKRVMDRSASDPERLTSRRRDPGRLLREEKFRKRFARLLPTVEQRLAKLIGKWEEAHPAEAPFMYQGEPVRETLSTLGGKNNRHHTGYAATTASSLAHTPLPASRSRSKTTPRTNHGTTNPRTPLGAVTKQNTSRKTTSSIQKPKGLRQPTAGRIK